MYIEIFFADSAGVTFERYAEIKALTFAPDVDVTGDTLPAPGFEADIATTDDLSGGISATLYDDMDRLWASFPLTQAERVDERTTHIQAQSVIALLDYVELEEAMFQAEPAANVISACLDSTTTAYDLSSSLASVPITGYCPAQTARERLTWALFVVGAYVKDVFTDRIKIKPVDETETLIPLNRTFWRPAVSHDEWVTAVKLTAYSFKQGTEEELKTSATYKFPLPWIATEQTFTLSNPDAPASAPPNVKQIDELYIVNPANASAILARLAKYWFRREKVSMDCVNNRKYAPGDLVVAFTDEATLVRGYIQSASFSFGVQARSALQLVGVDSRKSGTLTVNYRYDGTRIGQAKYVLPTGYAFSIENPYFDKTHNGHRYIYRPLTESATGTISGSTRTVNVDYEIALDLHNDVLTILSVDDITVNTGTDGTKTGVIA